MDNNYDLVVIGAGPGGFDAAVKAAQYGLKTAVAEERDLGGTCLNRGCIPTKTLLNSAHLYRELKDSDSIGVMVKDYDYDIEKIYNRKKEVVMQLRGGVESTLKSNKVDILRGKAKIIDSNTVVIKNGEETTEVKAKNILIASGSVPARPPIPGLELEGVITSDELLDQDGTDYKSMTIIGGGVIGVEFATVFSSFGCQVTVIEALDKILPTMDREISQNLAMIFKKRGIKVYAGSTVEKIEKGESGMICHFTNKGKSLSVESETVLVAIGRRANTENLVDDGVKIDIKRGVVVDDNFETSVKGIYAIGDVIDGGIQLAHVATAQGINVVARLAGRNPEIDLAVVPSCIYTDPEIAVAGISEAEAKAQGIKVKIGKYSMVGNGKSIIEKQERGFIKLVFDAETQVLLGAHLMCARATDIISELSSAIVNKLTAHQLAAVIRPHPTFTEGVTSAVENALR